MQIQSNYSGGAAATGAGGGFFTKFKVLPEVRFNTIEGRLKSAVVSQGDGEKIEPGMKIKVRYTGWTGHAKKFDSSLDRGEPFEFVIGEGRVIKGWEKGLLGKRVGDKLQLIIPPDMGYGERGTNNIPPGSTLIFNIEIVSAESSSKGNNPLAIA